MPELIKLKVVSSTKTVNQNFANKLVGKGEDVTTAFGKVEGGKRTFYMFTDQANAIGSEGEIDLHNFDVVVNDYPFTDDKGVEVIAKLNYLYPKRA